MAHLLLIDDDPSLLEVLTMSLEDAGHSVHCAADGTSGYAAILKERPDLVLCDVNLPGLDGFSLCRRLRESGNRVPLILLTSRDHEVDEALGLEFGADDYVTKPFATRVLLARIAALLRRESQRNEPEVERPFARDGLELYSERLEVRFQGNPVVVTVTEFRLLEALLRRAGRVLTRAQLLEIVRGDDSVVVDRIIDTYIRRLRRKLEQIDSSFAGIETVIGMGYRWRDAAGAGKGG